VNLLQIIVQYFSKRQQKLKNKNNGKTHATGQCKLCYKEYIEQGGDGCFTKGLERVCVEHRMQKELQKRQETGMDIKEEMFTRISQDFLDNVSLIDPKIANNGLNNIIAMMVKAAHTGKLDPDILKMDCKEEAKE